MCQALFWMWVQQRWRRFRINGLKNNRLNNNIEGNASHCGVTSPRSAFLQSTTRKQSMGNDCFLTLDYYAWAFTAPRCRDWVPQKSTMVLLDENTEIGAIWRVNTKPEGVLRRKRSRNPHTGPLDFCLTTMLHMYRVRFQETTQKTTTTGDNYAG